MRAFALLCITLAFGASGSCAPPTTAPDALALPLVDRFLPEQIQERRESAPIAASEWRFAALPATRGWSAGPGVADAAVRDGHLVATTSSPRPVVELTADRPLGGGDTLHSVEVRLRVSAGGNLTVNPLGAGGPPAAAFAGADAPGGLSTPLLAGPEVRTYRFTLTQSFGLGPVERGAVERVVLRPTDVAGAEFAVESVRLVYRREHLAALPSGIGWHGLGEIWRESLVTRPGEVVSFPLTLPRRPVLELAVGTLGEAPVSFRVAVRERDGDERIVLRQTVTEADRWHPDRVPLDAWAGDEIELVLRTGTNDDAGAALAFWGSPAVRSRLAGTAAPDADRPQGVIVVIADTLRRDHLDAWGYGRPTAPTLARLAGDGVRFSDAIAQAVWTKVSVPSILSSLYPSTHGITDFTHRLPAAATTLAEAYREAGYATFATSAIPFTGQLTNLHQGVEVLHESRSFRPADEEHVMKSARDYVGRALSFVEAHRDVPFFALVHVADPHAPYQPFEPYDRMWSQPEDVAWFRESEGRLRQEIPAADGARRRFIAPNVAELERAGVDAERFLAHEVGWYDGSIRAMDAELERLLDRLEHLGLADRVVIAFLADHGEEFLEHGSHFHGLNVYGENANVPLLLWGPRFVGRGVEVDETVQLVDVMPTLLEISGLPLPERAQGHSLLPLVRRPAAGASGPGAAVASPGVVPGVPERPAFTERAPEPNTLSGFAMVKGRWKLVQHVPVPAGRGELELYDHRADPLNRTDVAAAHPEVVRELAAELGRWREWARSQRLPPEDAGTVGAAELDRLRSLGYLD